MRAGLARAGVAGAIAAGLVLATTTPAMAWSSSYTPNYPGGCAWGDLVGQSWIASSYESRSTSAWEGNCAAYFVISGGHYHPLTARLRYASGGTSAGATTTASKYVTTTGWAHSSSYLGGYHNWGGVVLYS